MVSQKEFHSKFDFSAALDNMGEAMRKISKMDAHRRSEFDYHRAQRRNVYKAMVRNQKILMLQKELNEAKPPNFRAKVMKKVKQM